MPPIQFLIEKREAGQTISSVLRRRFQLTWNQAQRVVERGLVRVAGQTTRAIEQRVKTGNRVWIAAGAIEQKSNAPPKPKGELTEKKKSPAALEAKPKPKPAKGERPEVKKPLAPSFALEIVYADNSVVVVNKPAGLTTSRSREERDEFGSRARKFLPKTLADLLPAVLGEPNRPVVAVHRLDRETSGLLVFARTPAVAQDLIAQFRKHQTERRYIALTRGVPREGRIESVLVRDRGDGRRGSSTTAKSGDDGQRAVTIVKVLDNWTSFARVECRLETGRTHQVRIHLGEAGHPLCGERIYDRTLLGNVIPDGSGAERPLLHAARLGFRHPETQEMMTWEIDPPADFLGIQRILAGKSSSNSKLALHGNGSND
jgi:23S rRNA pseudouridine1911/1915/1917 synthase